MAKARKDVAGKMTVKELGNPSALAHAAVGGAIGSVIGSLGLFLLGPAAITVGGATGAALAGYAASQVEGMDKDKLEKIGAALKPGSSAIILVFDETVVSKADYERELEVYKESTDLLVEKMASKIKENLAQGNDVAFHICMDQDGIAATRVVVGDEAVNVRKLVLSSEGLAAAELTATEEGAAVEAVVATPEQVTQARALLKSSICAYEVATVTEDEAVYEAGVAVKDKQLEG